MLGPALFTQRNGPRSLTRNILAIFSALALVLGFTLASTPSAYAATNCTNLSPAIGEVVTCTVAGAASINIPAGARSVRIVAVGGGGAGGGGINPPRRGGNGGAGARVDGMFALTGGGTLSAQVGAGGTETLGSGDGGAFSRVQLGGTDLVIAGGGGGGAEGNPDGVGGSGGEGGMAAGGSGGNGVAIPPDPVATGGAGGSAGLGGAGGLGVSGGSGNNGDPGDTYADGGAGARGAAAGGGGAGYGGGGGGGSRGNQNIAGGGAGGSFTNPSLLVGTASFSPSTGPQGVGGEGGPMGLKTATTARPASFRSPSSTPSLVPRRFRHRSCNSSDCLRMVSARAAQRKK